MLESAETMTLRIGKRSNERMPPGRRGGFTLTELILVMAVLAIVLALAAPTLSGFVRGRSLQEEARRFLALTRYSRSEAVSSSVPMKLWIDPESGDYGMKPFPGYGIEDDKTIEWNLEDNLSFEIDPEAVGEDGLATIVFWPDGAIDSASVNQVGIQRGEEESITIKQAAYGLGYLVQNEERTSP